MKILVVDDESPARKKIRQYLKDEGIDSVLEAEDGLEAVKRIEEEKPDLVFLDIQMPLMTGFEVIRAVGVENMPTLVFVTAYDKYALEAFEVEAVDYLMKPFDQDRFKRSFDRAAERFRLKRDQKEPYQKILDQMRKHEGFLQRFMVKQGSRFFHVKTAEVMYISAEQKYMELHAEKKTYLIRETMNSIEESLDPEKFARIHRSTLLNVDYMQEIQPWFHGDCTVILKNGEKLTLSRRYRDRLIKKP
jgi:two-component system LytT family response regulator